MSIWSCVEYFDIFKMAAILSSLRNFLPEMTPEVEYSTKKAISICDILSFWSMLQQKYWQSYCSWKFWLIWSSDDVISDVVHNYLYTHIHNPMVHIYIQCNGDLSVICSVIMKKVHFSFIREYRGTISRSSCDVIDDVMTMKIFFLA